MKVVMMSDLHLGSAHTRADKALERLKEIGPTDLYLVGDLFEGWSFRRFSASDSRLIDWMITRVKSGLMVVYYCPGNHDSFAMEYARTKFHPGIKIKKMFSFKDGRGRQFVVTHGDIFDESLNKRPWLHKLAHFVYDKLLFFGKRQLAWLKPFVKNYFVSDFRSKALDFARRNGYNGIVCGHLHQPGYFEDGNIHYINCGDFIEHCSFVYWNGEELKLFTEKRG